MAALLVAVAKTGDKILSKCSLQLRKGSCCRSLFWNQPGLSLHRRLWQLPWLSWQGAVLLQPFPPRRMQVRLDFLGLESHRRWQGGISHASHAGVHSAHLLFSPVEIKGMLVYLFCQTFYVFQFQIVFLKYKFQMLAACLLIFKKKNPFDSIFRFQSTNGFF